MLPVHSQPQDLVAQATARCEFGVAQWEALLQDQEKQIEPQWYIPVICGMWHLFKDSLNLIFNMKCLGTAVGDVTLSPGTHV